jgi:hypothetical protein
MFDHSSEMEGRRQLNDVLNWRERFWNLSELIKTFPWKSITKMLTPTFSLYWYFSYRFSRKHFDQLGQVSKSSKQISLQFKMSLNSLRPSISELWSKQNEQKRNGVTELRGQAERWTAATVSRSASAKMDFLSF